MWARPSLPNSWGAARPRIERTRIARRTTWNASPGPCGFGPTTFTKPLSRLTKSGPFACRPASLWVTSAIGLATGVGDVATAAVAASLLVLTLIALRPARAVLQRVAGAPTRPVTLSAPTMADLDAALAELRAEDRIEVADVLLGRTADGVVARARVKALRPDLVESTERLVRGHPRVQVDSGPA